MTATRRLELVRPERFSLSTSAHTVLIPGLPVSEPWEFSTKASLIAATLALAIGFTPIAPTRANAFCGNQAVIVSDADWCVF